ncbi:hypothetical protein C8J42_101194 [Sphingomonas sp. PP-CE-1A-559]|uniref:hypothetical protein n=1 Tax=Sphingomonas sp. PP-CE-1A-559 TaxID=2135657 RepID=UPI0010550066|nr:hypothetical protein [Sphingomonas sp. PP-CE-1A-559]TCP93743.1 hypothetical protein C8J42_101194 [Sphingomonas sp. PP-CE-1A-559]
MSGSGENGAPIDEIDTSSAPVVADSRRTCGIIMPISAMPSEPDAYTAEHWSRVRKILERAIARAGFKPQLVWENTDADIIQSKILRNIYENDVIICDVSGLNPNVMLETGLRLSTKRPTVIITDLDVKPPFDIGTMAYIEYQRDLEYNAIEGFIERLAKRIKEVSEAFDKGSYISFVENYRFELVTPGTITVSSEDFLKERIDELASIARRIERGGDVGGSRTVRSLKQWEQNHRYIRVTGKMSQKIADEVETELDGLDAFHLSRVIPVSPNEHLFVIEATKESTLTPEDAVTIVKALVKAGEDRDI